MPTAYLSRLAAAGRRENRGSGLSGVSRGVYNAVKNFWEQSRDMPDPTDSHAEVSKKGGGRNIDSSAPQKRIRA